MKIASLLYGYKPGGVTDCVKRYAQIMPDSSIDINTVIIQKEDWGDNFDELKGTQFTILSFKQFLSLSWLWKLIKYLKFNQPSVLFVHAFNGAIIGLLSRLFYRKAKFVCTYHGIYISPVFYKKPLALIYNTLVLFIYKHFADGIVCVSHFSANELISKGVAGKKISVIHNGIPALLESVQPISVPKDEELIIITVCRLVPLKGIETLIDAVKQIERVKLYIVGDGPLRGDLEKRAKDHESSVVFVGTRHNVNDWLTFADVFVLASFVENHSISILEAMRAGKAIIATNVGGNPESIRDGLDGLLFQPGNTQELKAQIIKLRENRDLIETYGRSAHERFFAEFTEQRMHDKLITYFKSIQ